MKPERGSEGVEEVELLQSQKLKYIGFLPASAASDASFKEFQAPSQEKWCIINDEKDAKSFKYPDRGG